MKPELVQIITTMMKMSEDYPEEDIVNGIASLSKKLAFFNRRGTKGN